MLPLNRVFQVAAVDADELKLLQIVGEELEIAVLGGVHDAPSLQRAAAHGQRRLLRPFTST